MTQKTISALSLIVAAVCLILIGFAVGRHYERTCELTMICVDAGH